MARSVDRLMGGSVDCLIFVIYLFIFILNNIYSGLSRSARVV